MVRSRRTTTPNRGNLEVEDVGIVYRDHENHEHVDGNDQEVTTPDDESFYTTSSEMLPLELDIDKGKTDGSDNEEGNFDHDEEEDGASSYYSSNNYLLSKIQHRHPAYTPQLFITHPHLAVLPVLLLEFLSLALTRAVLPSLLIKRYGSQTYIVMGVAECVRGILAFFACPLFGKLSDVWGRRPCLLITVLGTLAPVCSLVFWKMEGITNDDSDIIATTVHDELEIQQDIVGEDIEGSWYPTFLPESVLPVNLFPGIHRIDVFVVLLALSGMFSSTFTLTFAYISDVVKDRDGRVAAFGLALATFGLSFTIGPLLGGYLANVDDEGNHDETTSDEPGHTDHEFGSKNSDIHPLGQHRVFFTSLILAILDLFYIHFLLPESLNSSKRDELEHATVSVNGGHDDPETDDNETPSSSVMAATSDTSNVPIAAGVGVSRRASSSWWNPFDSVRYLMTDPLLSTIGRVTFLYYTALHAVVSTLVLYAARQFHLGPQRLGELMAALGLSTMVSEAVLVRLAIPLLGETKCMRIGLVSFAMQCVLLAVADSPWQLFACAFLAMAGNLVYPSISSLVSSTVEPDMVGRALGAVNGVKSLTEGVGPLVFGTLLTMSEKDRFPGWPYFLAAIMVALAYQAGRDLPEDTDEYTTEMYIKNRANRRGMRKGASIGIEEEYDGLLDGA